MPRRGARATLTCLLAVAVPLVPGAAGMQAASAQSVSAQTVNASMPSVGRVQVVEDSAVQDRVTKAIAGAVGTRADDVSVSVHDRQTGTYVRHNASLRNHTGSIVKVMVLVALVRERRDAGLRLSNYERSLARRMITTSDNDATTTLFNRIGGRSTLQRLAGSLGMTRTEVSGSWGLTTTTAADQGLLIDRIIDGDAFSDPDDQAYVVDLMGKVVPEQAWGVGAIPESADVAMKNGWIPLESRGWRVNSIGHVTAAGRNYTLSMLSYDNATMDDGVKLLNAVSRAVYGALAAKPARSSEVSSGGGEQRSAQRVPQGAPYWLVGPGTAFPPYPAW